MIITFRLYACALVFAVWAVCWWAGVRGTFATGVFLTVTAVAFVIAEGERSRQRRMLREKRR